jgi:hypothetical protein
MGRDLFDSPKRRIRRANEHIRNLEARIKRFFKDEPYRRIVELNTSGSKEIHKIRFIKPFPDRPGELAFEAGVALRSALDQVGYATAVASGKVRPKSAYFPIADSAVQLETDVIGRGRCGDLPQEILALFRNFKPYKGGNDSIWALNKICNSRHIVLLEPIAMALGQIHFRVGRFSGGTEFFSSWDAEKNEIAFASLPIGSNPQYDAQISIMVAFGDVEGVRGEEAASSLRTMASEVERIVLTTEAETRRLGLVPRIP